MNPKRLRILKVGIQKTGPVLYWMQRDQRVYDNWALIYAQEEALKRSVPLIVVFNLVPSFLGATIRHYGFMLRSLSEVDRELKKFNVSFILLSGDPLVEIPAFISQTDSSLLIADFNPLKIVRRWKKQVADNINIPFHEVDAHNIVPCLVASNKLELAAYTIRPKIHNLLPEFLDEFPQLKKMKNIFPDTTNNDWQKIIDTLDVDRSVKEVDWILPGEKATQEMLNNFIYNKLNDYPAKRNDPNIDGTSNLSSYLHFGQISSQRIVLEIIKQNETSVLQNSFLEELIIRKELSDNFCYFNKKYDSFEGFPIWAQQTLNIHRKDKREHLYSTEEFEKAETHDDLWNTAQREMVNTGKMHGFLRMYWAKKILEWSPTPEDALKIAIHLNDKYELDGRDPNGYTGIAWSIGGVHDRPWVERKVFGKIRYMNYLGCKRKFDVIKYIQKD
ncbi:MAG: deoxyribodipyrimidine photo-lyase [Bacteroidota bacterium]